MHKFFTLAALSVVLSAAQAGDQAPARKPAAKVTFHKSTSEESPAAREKRLKRECQGRPNAGACLGLATP